MPNITLLCLPFFTGRNDSAFSFYDYSVHKAWLSANAKNLFPSLLAENEMRTEKWGTNKRSLPFLLQPHYISYWSGVNANCIFSLKWITLVKANVCQVFLYFFTGLPHCISHTTCSHTLQLLKKRSNHVIPQEWLCILLCACGACVSICQPWNVGRELQLANYHLQTQTVNMSSKHGSQVHCLKIKQQEVRCHNERSSSTATLPLISLLLWNSLRMGMCARKHVRMCLCTQMSADSRTSCTYFLPNICIQLCLGRCRKLWLPKPTALSAIGWVPVMVEIRPLATTPQSKFDTQEGVFSYCERGVS